MWLSHHKVSSSVCTSNCLVRSLALLCVQRWATHKARRSLPPNKSLVTEHYIIECTQIKPEQKTKSKSKLTKQSESKANIVNSSPLTISSVNSCNSSNANNVTNDLEDREHRELTKTSPRLRKRKQRSELANAKNQQKAKVNLTCKEKTKSKVVSLSSLPPHQSSEELEEELLLLKREPLLEPSPSSSLLAQSETVNLNQPTDESVSLPQFTEKNLKENDIRLGMRLLMMTYFNKKYYDKKPREDERSRERERLEEKHKTSRERLETKTLNSQQLLSKEGSRIGDGIVPLFVKPSSLVNDKSKSNNARSWMDLNPVASNTSEQKSRGNTVISESLKHKLATRCEASANSWTEKASSSTEANVLNTKTTEALPISNDNVCSSDNSNCKTIPSHDSSFIGVNEMAMHNSNNNELGENECSDAELNNNDNNDNNNNNQEESLKLDLLEDLSQDTFKDASLEELCLPDLSLYTDENDIRVDSKTFLEYAKNNLEPQGVVSSERANLQSPVTNTLENNENGCMADSGFVHELSMDLNMRKVELEEEKFAHAKDNVVSTASKAVTNNLNCTDSSKENQNVRATFNTSSSSICNIINNDNISDSKRRINTSKATNNDAVNNDVSVDFNNNNDENSTLSKLNSLNATATSQAQLWERLVEENEDEDFSVASYAGQKEFFGDDDNNNEYKDDIGTDNNSSSKKICRKKFGLSLDLDVNSDYRNVDYADDDDNDDNNDFGRDDIY